VMPDKNTVQNLHRMILACSVGKSQEVELTGR
jgi:hypothetical protein